MNILIITPNTIDTTSFYRAWGVFPNIARTMGDINLITDKGKSMSWVDIGQMDLIYMHRPYTIEQYNFAQYAKEMKVPLWVDFDDDLTSIPEWMSFYNLYMQETTQKIIAGIISMADVVTTSTQALANRFTKLNTMIQVIPNALNDDIFSTDQLPYSEKKVVLWRGSETHHMDLMHFTEAIASCVTREEWEWMYFGFNPWFLPKTKHIPVMDPVMYFRTMKSIHPAVMFVPLIKDTFNQCKSNINWLEATMSGSIALVPDWEVWDVPGVFRYEDTKTFGVELQYLMSGESYFVRKQSYQASWDYIKDNLLLSIVNKQRVQLIEMLVK